PGGGGSLGAVLVRSLVGSGAELHLLLRPGNDRWRLAGLGGAFTAHEADLTDAAAVSRAVRRSRPDVVYHLAAGGARDSHPDPLGTANLLAALAADPCRALVYTGTGAEYGPRDEAVPEDTPARPQTDYARANAAATQLC